MEFYTNILFFLLIGLGLSFLGSRKQSNLIFVIEALVIMLVVALRNESIGTDTTTYCYIFLHPNADAKDAGFGLYNAIIRLFTKNSDCYIFITAVFSFLPIFYSIWRDSRNKCFSIFVFVTMGTTILYYALYFASMRHCLAVGLLMLLVHFVRNKVLTSLPIIILCNLVIGTIHLVTFVFLPVFLLQHWFNKGENISKSSLILLLILSFIIGLNLQNYMQYISVIDVLTEGRFGYYLDYVSSAEYKIGTTIPLMLLAILFVYFSPDNFRNDLYFITFIIGVCINNLMVMAADSSRFTLTFLFSSCIIIPNFFYEFSLCKKRKHEKYLKIGLFLVIAIYYSSKYIKTWNNIIEYDNATYVPYHTNSIVSIFDL